MDDAFKEVVAAHVPLIIYNSGGMDSAKRLGAMNYVGNEEYTAGLGGGDYFGSHGVKNVLCINTLPAQQYRGPVQGHRRRHRQARRQVESVAAAVVQLRQPTAVAQAIKAALLKDGKC